MRSRKAIIFSIFLLVVGFATVSTTLLLNGTIGIGANTDDYNVVFASAKIGNANQEIKTTNKSRDTLEFNVDLINNEEKVLEYTIKNNSTQYESNAKMKCFAVNDTNNFLSEYINISGELDGEAIAFGTTEANATLSNEVNFKPQEIKNGTITMSLKRSYAGTETSNTASLSIKCEIITNADISDDLVETVFLAGLYDANNNMLCNWDECGIDVSSDYVYSDISSNPSHITYIVDNFYPTATKVVVPDGITNIGANAFRKNKKMTSVILPNSVTSIGNNAFQSCEKLINIVIPDGVTSIGNYAFDNCLDLTSITLPSNLKTIGNHAFWYVGISSISIPNGVTTIGDYAFSKCYNLESVTIPDSVTYIGSYAFEYSGLKNLVIPGSVSEIKISTFQYSKQLTSVTILDGVTNIENSAFYGCQRLESVILPDTVINIGSNTFGYCASLIDMVIPDEVETIGYGAFSNVKHITYNGSATGSPWSAQSTNINSKTLDGGISYLSLDETTLLAVSNSVHSYSIPSSVTTIGSSAFYYNEKLTNVIIPSSVTHIGFNAFAHCENVENIIVPDTVTTIDYGAFDSVPHITYNGSATGNPWGADSIN